VTPPAVTPPVTPPGQAIAPVVRPRQPDVQVLPRVITAGPAAPAAQVRGQVAAQQLPRTGLPLTGLAVMGLLSLAMGAGLVRRSTR